MLTLYQLTLPLPFWLVLFSKRTKLPLTPIKTCLLCEHEIPPLITVLPCRKG